MKNIIKDKKMIIIVIFLILIVIAGIIVASIKGYNYDLIYSKNTKMEIYIDKDFKSYEIKGIVKEVLGKGNVLVQTGSHENELAVITAKSITDEQSDNIITRINEKYETDIEKADIKIASEGEAKIYNIIKPYINSILITTLIILLYNAIRYRKMKLYKVIIITVRRYDWKSICIF